MSGLLEPLLPADAVVQEGLEPSVLVAAEVPEVWQHEVHEGRVPGAPGVADLEKNDVVSLKRPRWLDTLRWRFSLGSDVQRQGHEPTNLHISEQSFGQTTEARTFFANL